MLKLCNGDQFQV